MMTSKPLFLVLIFLLSMSVQLGFHVHLKLIQFRIHLFPLNISILFLLCCVAQWMESSPPLCTRDKPNCSLTFFVAFHIQLIKFCCLYFLHALGIYFSLSPFYFTAWSCITMIYSAVPFKLCAFRPRPFSKINLCHSPT